MEGGVTRPLRPALVPWWDFIFGPKKNPYGGGRWKFMGYRYWLCYCATPGEQEDPDAQQDEGFPPEEWTW